MGGKKKHDLKSCFLFCSKYLIIGFNMLKLGMTIEQIQQAVYQNKLDKGFNVTDVNKEFCLLYGETSEAYESWQKKKDDVGEELADVAIYLLGLAEILGVSLEQEIYKKMKVNTCREYETKDGVLTKKKKESK